MKDEGYIGRLLMTLPFASPILPRFRVFPQGGIMGMAVLGAALFAGCRESGIFVVVEIALLSFMFWRSPPSIPSTKAGWGILLSLAVAPWLAFVPRLSRPVWHAVLERAGFTEFSPLHAVQPWVTIAILPEYYAGLGLAWWLLGQTWTESQRRNMAIVLASGMAATFRVFLFFRTAIPTGDTGLGFFPSRNQTGMLLAMAGMLQIGLLESCLMRRSRWAMLWGALLVASACGTLANGSRAGILLLGLGCGLYGMLCAVGRGKPVFAGVGLAAMCAMIAAFLLFGGTALERLVPVARQTQGESFRLKVQTDALTMTRDEPWTGVGLGSFDVIFPFYRVVSAKDYRTQHPENDWLYFAGECGWPATILIFCVLLAVLWRMASAFVAKPRPTRTAGLICTVIFLIHTFMDQSAHNQGTLFFVFFAAAIALPDRQERGPHREPWRSGVALAFLGFAGLQAVCLLVTGIPGPAPLDWKHHNAMGQQLLEGDQIGESVKEFKIAMQLEPFSSYLAESAGLLVFEKDPDLSAEFLTLAVLRSDGELRNQRYAFYLQKAEAHPRLRESLEKLADSDLQLALVRLQLCQPKNFPALQESFARAIPPEKRSVLGKAMAEEVMKRGGAQAWMDFQIQHPEFCDSGRITLVKMIATEGRMNEAVRMGLEFLPPRGLPSANEENAGEPMVKALAWIASGQLLPEAQQVLEIEAAKRETPAFVYYFLAQLAHGEQNDDLAWKYFEAYLTSHP